MPLNARHILTLNSGSSSLKFSLYRMDGEEVLEVSGSLQRIGLERGSFGVRDGMGQSLHAEEIGLPDHEAALDRLFAWLPSYLQGRSLAAAGHRIVHGGRRFVQPTRVSHELIAALADLAPLAPNHLPSEIECLRAVAAAYPKLPQVACFDTAFHASMPALARTYALPREVRDAGVERYGFHGLSYEYLVRELRRIDPEAAAGKVIFAHLGNGASMAAVRNGQCIDTTMGLTPLGGLVMGTRCGDLDPGVVLFLWRELKLGLQEVDDLLNQRSGILGLSGSTSDMKDLLDRAASDADARLAVEVYCARAAQQAAALAASLGGVDTLVFSAGVGENAAPVREQIVRRLEFLGARLDADRNARHEAVISAPTSRIVIRVMKTNEELMIVRQTVEVAGLQDN